MTEPNSRPTAAVTKVERVVESIESFMNAVCTMRERADDDSAKAMQDVLDAREECADALHAFLTPVLRVVQ